MDKPAKPQNSIFTINVCPEYRSIVEDITRMTVIQLMVNSLFHLSNPGKYSFFSGEFLKTLLFIVVGVSCYWLVVSKIVSFGPDDYKDQQFYYGRGN